MADGTALRLRIAAELRPFLPLRKRGPEVSVPHDATATLGHVVQSVGVPLTEVGRLTYDGRAVEASHRPEPGGVVDVLGIRRPQPLPVVPLRLLLDVHLGALARRLRMVGLDTVYRNDLDDATLVEWANAEQRVLLTQDRRLLHRRALEAGAYVYGRDPDGQVVDVLQRFAPPLAPLTRCTVCNGPLAEVDKHEVAHLLQPGTRAGYDSFARCRDCARIYWPGAHHQRIWALVEAAERSIATANGAR